MTMRVTITAANVFSSYGILMPIGSIQTVTDEFGLSLVQSQRATDTDGALTVLPNTPFVGGRVLGFPRTYVEGMSQIARAAARFALKASNPIGNVFGDSYAGGAGATVTANGYAQRLVAELASVATWGNYARAGYPLSKYSSAPLVSGTGPANASQVQIAKDTVSFGIIGLNDLRGVSQDSVATTGCGPNPDNYATLRSKVQAMALQFLIPEVNKVRMRNVAQTALNNVGISIVGSWTQSLNGNSAFIYTTNNGQQIIIPKTPVGNLLIVHMGKGSAETNSFTIAVDGVVLSPLMCKCSYDAWSEDCVIYRLPNTGAHEVVLTTVVSGGACVIESVSCVDTTLSDFGATLLYGTPIYLNDGSNIGWGLTGVTANSASAASATGGAAWNYGNGACDRFSAAIKSAMDELYELGFNVAPVDTKAGWDASYMLNADTIHPNNAGHLHLYNRFASPMRTLFGI